MLRSFLAALCIVWFSVACEARTVLSSDLILYVNGLLGNDASDCTAAGGACATPQRAVDLAANVYDLAGHNITIQLAGGQTFSSSAGPVIAFKGGVGYGTIIVDGTAGNPATINDTAPLYDAIDTFAGSNGPIYLIQNLNIRASGGGGGGCGVLIDNPGVLRVGNGVNFQQFATAAICAADPGAIVQPYGSFMISGSGKCAFNISAGAGWIFSNEGSTITFAGDPVFSNAVMCVTAAIAQSLKTTFYGSPIGARYDVALNGALMTFGGGPNYFPGSSPGIVGTGGQYE